eukprot:s42_g2.t1
MRSRNSGRLNAVQLLSTCTHPHHSIAIHAMRGLHVGRLGCGLRASRLCLPASRGCAGTVASEALQAAAGASSSAPERVALFRHCVDSISALGGAGQELPWWSDHAVEEEEQMLQDLSRALPRGGRVAPGLLEAMVPTLPAPTEVVARQLPSVLGAREGLTALLRWRVALRRVAEAAPTPQFAVERLEGRLLRLLSLWLNEGFLCCSEVSEVQPDEVRLAAAAAATGDRPEGIQRCFALQMPQMGKAGLIGPPLLALHAAMQPSPDGGQRALIWSIGFCDEVVPPGSLRGFGLGQTLRRAATAQLLAEGAAEIAAAVPLKSFRTWLRRVQPWHQRGLPGEVQAQLDKATSGAALPELSFRDAAGDDVSFRLSRQRQLEVSFNGQSAETVRQLKFLESAVLVLLETGGMQIDLPKEAEKPVDLALLKDLALAAGHIGPELRDPLLNFAFQYLCFPGEGRASDPLVHFHLLGGGDFASLGFAATESPTALAESFGIFATFRYHGGKDEARRAANYAERGVRALLEVE